tara:strand:- start:1037 stop:1273 length:237 start_codon:yes stop_codon:yes gene_type:complete
MEYKIRVTQDTRDAIVTSVEKMIERANNTWIPYNSECDLDKWVAGNQSELEYIKMANLFKKTMGYKHKFEAVEELSDE